MVRSDSHLHKAGFRDEESCFIKDRKGDMPNSSSLHRKDPPELKQIKRMVGVHRTLYTPTIGWVLGETSFGEETMIKQHQQHHLFHAGYRESQIIGKIGAFAIVEEKDGMESMYCGDGTSKSHSSENQFAQVSFHG